MKHIVTVGGGKGSYTVLSGLKTFPDVFLTALVSMADDGGSTGVLRRKWGVMPPGDVRQCLVALSGKEFLNRRVGRHKLGNILLAVMEKITGDFSRGLKILSFVFNAKGKIIPITKDAAVLCAELKGGEVITGESKIDTADLQTENGGDNLERIFYERNTILNPLGRDAILAADYIIIGPGNIYCSIIPNLIAENFQETIQASKAKIIFLVNLVNKQGHTMGWNTERYISTVEKYLGRKADFILINKGEFSGEQKERYLKDAGEEVFIKNEYGSPRVIREDLLSNKISTQNNNDSVKRSLIRHDSLKLAKVIAKIIT